MINLYDRLETALERTRHALSTLSLLLLPAFAGAPTNSSPLVQLPGPFVHVLWLAGIDIDFGPPEKVVATFIARVSGLICTYWSLRYPKLPGGRRPPDRLLVRPLSRPGYSQIVD